MLEDTHVLDSLPAYALGCLDEDEDQLVSEHLASCYLCRTELDSFQAIADGLALAVPDATPPAGMKQRLVERVRGLEPARPQTQGMRRPFFQRLLPLGGI